MHSQRCEDGLAVQGASDISGRVATWEADLSTGEARWDPTLFQLIGLPEAPSAPSFEDWLAHVHADDRDAALLGFRSSLALTGRHEARFRLTRADGGQSSFHHAWEVLAGADGRPGTVRGMLIDDTRSIGLARDRGASDLQLSLAAGLMGLSLWRIDLATQRIRANEWGFELIGLLPHPDGLPVADLRTVVHPDDRARLEEAARVAIESFGVADCEARYRLPDGSYRTLLTRRMAERNADGKPVSLVGVSLDISQQVEARRREQESSMSMRLIAEAAEVGVWGVDPQTGSARWNIAMQDIFHAAGDVSTRQAARDALLRHVHPDDLERVRASYDLIAEGRAPASEIEFRLLLPGGVVRWLVARARTVVVGDARRVVGAVMDVTERRAREERVMQAEARAKLATSGIGMGVWERDLVRGVSIWDEQMYRLRGLSPDDPRSPDELRRTLIHPDDLAELERRSQSLLERGSEAQHTFRVVWPDGSVHWLATRGYLERDERGQPIRCSGVNWDVTGEKQGEEIRRQKSAAEAANRAKSLFLARVSHELRTPLNAVLGFAQMMESDSRAPLPPQQAQRLSLIQEAGQHLLALISDTLDLASIELGTLPVRSEPTDVAAVVEQARRWVSTQADRAGIRIDVGPIDAWVLADARRLCQVLVNLMSNGIKYNRRGGSVSLSARRGDDDRIVIDVADDGRGMSEAQRNRLFAPFERLGVDRDGIEGAGIGLSLVAHLVRRMDGAIAVDSTPGVGSVFHVSLPAVASTRAGARDERADQDAGGLMPAPVQPLRDLLCVDDDPVTQLLLQELVAMRPGLRLHTAADGMSAIVIARRTRPRLVFLDLSLPDFDGFDVLRRLRADPTLGDVRVIAMSASLSPRTVERARNAGFVDCWEKPIDARRFLAGLDRWLDVREEALGEGSGIAQR